MRHAAPGATEGMADGAAAGEPAPLRAAGESFPVVLVSPYELGRQPFGIAEAAAWLRDAGFPVRCIDLSRERLDPEALRGAGLVAVHLAMHTAGRIAAAAFGRIRALAPRARLAVFGLYAPVNEGYFRELGAEAVLGGEIEPALVALARECRDGYGPGHGKGPDPGRRPGGSEADTHATADAHIDASARNGARERAAAGTAGGDPTPHRKHAPDARSRAKQGREHGIGDSCSANQDGAAAPGTRDRTPPPSPGSGPDANHFDGADEDTAVAMPPSPRGGPDASQDGAAAPGAGNRRQTEAASGAGARGDAARGIHLDKIDFLVPDRSGLPPLDQYAKLELPDGGERIVGFAEASRGCKHLCRHCPIVPVYDGRFRVVPRDVVLADVRQQVAAGAEHISFGDPDFFNGPTHGLRIAAAMRAEHPRLTFDATIKIEHLLRHRARLPALREAGCLFVTSAVEAVDDEILARLRKNHTTADFEAAAALMRAAGIALAPTFVAFTPWTTLAGYRDLLERIAALGLVASVPPVQLSIRLLVPGGSRLLELAEVRDLVGPFDRTLLGYPWSHPDPRVDVLQARIADLVERDSDSGASREETFAAAWAFAHEALGAPAPALPGDLGAPIPRHSEPWYCCAEPTGEQLAGF